MLAVTSVSSAIREFASLRLRATRSWLAWPRTPARSRTESVARAPHGHRHAVPTVGGVTMTDSTVAATNATSNSTRRRVFAHHGEPRRRRRAADLRNSSQGGRSPHQCRGSEAVGRLTFVRNRATDAAMSAICKDTTPRRAGLRPNVGRTRCTTDHLPGGRVGERQDAARL